MLPISIALLKLPLSLARSIAECEFERRTQLAVQISHRASLDSWDNRSRQPLYSREFCSTLLLKSAVKLHSIAMTTTGFDLAAIPNSSQLLTINYHYTNYCSSHTDIDLPCIVNVLKIRILDSEITIVVSLARVHQQGAF